MVLIWQLTQLLFASPIVDVNDNVPAFTNGNQCIEQTLSESIGNNALVATVQTSDLDTGTNGDVT